MSAHSGHFLNALGEEICPTGCPAAREAAVSGVTAKLRTEIGYDAMEDSPIDTLIAYKDALEELVDRIDEAMRANAGKADYSMSAADITGMLYGMGFGE